MATSEFQALPFIHDIIQKDKMAVHMNGYVKGDKEEEGENENADFFNFVMKDDDFDDIYLL